VLGEQEATVLEIRSFDLHGVTYHDVRLSLADGSTLDARLGPEAVPDGLRDGERVLATLVAGLVVSMRRP
jgi:hypothetical protein